MRRCTYALAAVLASSCLLLAQDAQARRGKTAKLRAMTFNIRFDFPDDGPNRWKNRADLVAKTIQGSQAHIVCLQEDKEEQVDDLKARLPEFEFIGRGRNATGSGERCSILYDKKRFRARDTGSFWLSDTPEVPGSNTWGDKYPRVVTWAYLEARKSKKGVLVVNTHFAEGSRDDIRMKGMGVIQKWLLATAGSKKMKRSKVAVLLTGDFNEDGGGSAPHSLLTDSSELPLRDAWKEAPPAGKSTGTFNGFRGMQTRNRIDWIMVAGPVRVYQTDKIDQDVDGRWPSDHYPVVADLEIF